MGTLNTLLGLNTGINVNEDSDVLNVSSSFVYVSPESNHELESLFSERSLIGWRVIASLTWVLTLSGWQSNG